MSTTDNNNPATASAGQKRKASEMASSENQQPPKVITLLDHPDATFRVGKEPNILEIKVSSVVMTLASPVFAAELTGGFVEGQTKTVELPEDDPEVFLQFCKILHHHPTTLDELSGSQLVALAILADMRKCLPALLPWMNARTASARDLVPTLYEGKGGASAFLLSWSFTMPMIPDLPYTPFDLDDFIEISIVFSFKLDFWRATRQCMALFDITRAADMVKKQGKDNVPGLVNAKGQDVYTVMLQAYHEKSETFLSELFATIAQNIPANPASCQTHKHGAWHIRLRKSGIVPERIAQHPHSLARTFNKVQLLAFSTTGGFPELSSKCARKVNGRDCAYCQRDWHSDIKMMVERHSLGLLGMCLHCFQAGRTQCFNTEMHVHQCSPERAQAYDDEIGASDNGL